MAQEIKKQVLAELNHPSFQAYCQLVEAVRKEILHDLKNSQPAYPKLSPKEIEQIKNEILLELQGVKQEKE